MSGYMVEPSYKDVPDVLCLHCRARNQHFSHSCPMRVSAMLATCRRPAQHRQVTQRRRSFAVRYTFAAVLFVLAFAIAAFLCYAAVVVWDAEHAPYFVRCALPPAFYLIGLCVMVLTVGQCERMTRH